MLTSLVKRNIVLKFADPQIPELEYSYNSKEEFELDITDFEDMPAPPTYSVKIRFR